MPGFDMELLQREYARLDRKPGVGNFVDNTFVPPLESEGSYVLRFLPSRDDAAQKGQIFPFFTTRTHKINGKNIYCPCNLIGEKWQGVCPICNEWRCLWKEKDNADDDDVIADLEAKIDDIKPNERSYWNCIIRQLKDESNVGPRIFSTGKQLQSKLLRVIGGDQKLKIKGLGDVTDVENGRDLLFVKRIVKSPSRSGKMREFPNYTDSEFQAPSKAGTDEEIAKWLSNLHDLHQYRKLLSYEELDHEVQVYKGLKEDPSEAFSRPKSPEPAVSTSSSAVLTSSSTPKFDEDEAGVGSDWMERLKNM